MIRISVRSFWTLIAAVALIGPAGWARGQEAATDDTIELVVGLLSDADKEMRAIGLEQVRSEAKGEAATRKFAELLAKGLPSDAQVGLINALTDRGDAAARPAIVELLASPDGPVKTAAANSLGYLGQAEDVGRLVALLRDGDESLRGTARASLIRMPHPGASAAIVTELTGLPADSSQKTLRIALVEILAARRASAAAESLVPLAVDAEPAVRTATMTALGQLAGPAQIPGMLSGILKAEKGAEREGAEKAVMFVCSRIEDPAQRAAPLLSAIEALPEAQQRQLWPTLGRVGGETARQAIEKLIADPKSHDIGLRAICNWPDASIAPRLTELVQQEQHGDHRTSALRALVRVAVLPDDRTDTQRLELLKQALGMCDRDAERTLVLQRARAIRSVDSLRFLLPFVDRPAFMEQACLSIVELAHHRALRDANKAEFHAALDKVMATSKDATTVERARRYKNNQTWNRATGS